MTIVNIDKIDEKEYAPGVFGRVVHSDNMTVIYWRIVKGSKLPNHSHINEQLTQLTKGDFELTVDNKKIYPKTNNIVLIPSNAEHSGYAITDCYLTDVFYPVREDLK
jgi:unsaturated pyranuronate lyase